MGRFIVLANFDIVTLHGPPAADTLLLDAFCDRKTDRIWIWTLTTASLLHAFDRGHTLDELRGYLNQACLAPRAQTVTTLLDVTAAPADSATQGRPISSSARTRHWQLSSSATAARACCVPERRAPSCGLPRPSAGVP